MNLNLSGLNNADFKKAMRKFDFPLCAKEALARVGKYCFVKQLVDRHQYLMETFSHSFVCSNTEHLCASKKNHDHCMEIIAEYIFLEKKWSDSRKASSQPIGLTVFQEFHLVLVFAEFFSRPGRDVTRNTVFLSLFGSSLLPPARARVLSKFVSTAITDSIAPVSECIASRVCKKINYFLIFRFYARQGHGCNKSVQIHCHA